MPSSRSSSSKKVSILYTDSPRTSNDSFASQSSAEYSPRYSYDMATTSSSNNYRYDGYSGSAMSTSSGGSRDSSSGSSADRLVRSSDATKGILYNSPTTASSSLNRSLTASSHGYYAKDRTHSSGKKVTVHNHEKRSVRDDEPRTGSSYRQ